MTNMIDFFRETAKYMYLDRPDVFSDPLDAYTTLTRWHEDMEAIPGSCVASTGGFMFVKSEIHDDIFEYALTRIISTAANFMYENEVVVLGWTATSGTLKQGVDLPEPGDTVAEPT